MARLERNPSFTSFPFLCIFHWTLKHCNVLPHIWNKSGFYPNSMSSPLFWHQVRSIGVMIIVHVVQAGFEPWTFSMKGEYHSSEPYTLNLHFICSRQYLTVFNVCNCYDAHLACLLTHWYIINHDNWLWLCLFFGFKICFAHCLPQAKKTYFNILPLCLILCICTYIWSQLLCHLWILLWLNA